VKIKEILSELRHAITMPTKGSLGRAILFIIAICIIAAGLSLLMGLIFPSEGEFKNEFIPKYGDYAYPAIFVITLLSSFSIVFPVPGTVLWLLLVKHLELNIVLAAFIAAVGGTLGEITGYYLGYAGRAVIAPGQIEKYKETEGWVKRYGGWAIFLFAFFPFLIFDFIGIATGAFRYPLRKFLLFAFIGRLPRSLIEAYAGVAILDFVLDHLPFF
jgi:membrane protein YqaA with SNARE-associated domain